MALFSAETVLGNGGGTGERRRLRAVEDFGSNPGNLRMYFQAPTSGATGRPCVVVLHGCGQTARGYDAASGWSALAEQFDFALVFAEQKTANNERTCFSWFEPSDVRRGCGEVESIRQMVDAAARDAELDRARVFVCGLSAGGAMANAMLAVHPEMFAGGAIIAGLPYGAASGVSSALDLMYRGRLKEAAAWGDAVRNASAHSGPWPRVALWHGTEDAIVRPINAGELVKQWTDVHGVRASTPKIEQIGPAVRRTWHGSDGDACVREYTLRGVGHGAPVDDAVAPAPFFIPCGISSTRQIAEDFGLTVSAAAPGQLAPVAAGARH